jgi:hypothetical protein
MLAGLRTREEHVTARGGPLGLEGVSYAELTQRGVNISRV